MQHLSESPTHTSFNRSLFLFGLNVPCSRQHKHSIGAIGSEISRARIKLCAHSLSQFQSRFHHWQLNMWTVCVIFRLNLQFRSFRVAQSDLCVNNKKQKIWKSVEQVDLTVSTPFSWWISFVAKQLYIESSHESETLKVDRRPKKLAKWYATDCDSDWLSYRMQPRETRMKLFLLLCTALLALTPSTSAQGDEKYSRRYDNIDVNTIFRSSRLLNNYVDCLLDKKPCPPEGKDLKRESSWLLIVTVEKLFIIIWWIPSSAFRSSAGSRRDKWNFYVCRMSNRNNFSCIRD